ncbi:MAG TPA: hypothetical protein VNU97_15570 [Rhizomicrobium sp.]|jgi:hypothetical protein|nr:hypothetical protein [Rhizomicrobium sp.]
MSDDTDLTRLFAQAPQVPGDEAFVARVAGRLAWQRRLALALPAAAAAVLLLAVWATWPAAFAFSRDALSGLEFLVDATTAFCNSPPGRFAAGLILVTGALWAWLFERLRGQIS